VALELHLYVCGLTSKVQTETWAANYLAVHAARGAMAAAIRIESVFESLFQHDSPNSPTKSLLHYQK